MRDAGDYYKEKAEEARRIQEELNDKIRERVVLTNEIAKLRRQLEQARYVGD